MFPFNVIPEEREPTKEELIEGLVHHLSTALLLHGAGKHFCRWVNEIRLDTLSSQDVRKIMNHNSIQTDKVKTILANLPTIDIDTGG